MTGHRDTARRAGRVALMLALAFVAGAAIGQLVGGRGAAVASPARRATVLYPRSSGLIFDHAKHLEVACAKCHAKVSSSVSARDRNTPREAACRPCHAKITRRDDSPAARRDLRKACATCHAGFDPAGGRWPARVAAPQARVRFSHRLHANKRVACRSCHDVRSASSIMPTMATCLSCHRATKATQRCVSCHLSKKDGRLVTRFGRLRLRPSGTLKGDMHSLGFERRHKQVARGNNRYCQSCHAPHECLKCHQGTYKPMSIHPNDYATHHALDAKLSRRRCQSCHRSQTFCLSCHQRSGVSQKSPLSGFKPNTGQRFHPQGFSTRTVGPNHHAFKARRNIRVCASCHSEKSCVRCHGTRKLGHGGFSPHGKNFARSMRCRALAARNRRVCLKCHRSTDSKLSCQ